MKLTSITLKNIKCFDNYSVNLTDKNNIPLSVCVLLGANGAGKTTVLKSIVSTFSIMEDSYKGEIFTSDAIKIGNKSGFVDIKIALNDYEKSVMSNCTVYDSISSEYDIIEVDPDTFEPYNEDVSSMPSISAYGLNYFMTENFEEEFQCGLAVPYDIATSSSVGELTKEYSTFIHRLNSVHRTLVVYFDSVRYLTSKNPESPNFSQTITRSKEYALSSSISEGGVLSPRFFDLKQWFVNLDFAMLKNPNSPAEKIYNHFITACNILFEPLQFNGISEVGDIMFMNTQTDEMFDLNMLSDGFKSVFIIIAELLHRLSLAYNPEKDNDIEFYEMEAIVLIDEVDCHLHPRWQANLLPALTSLFPNCQFIVTTHSPYILKNIPSDSIIRIGEDPVDKQHISNR